MIWQNIDLARFVCEMLVKVSLRMLVKQLVTVLQDARRKWEEERQKQLRWREEHRNALLRSRDSVNVTHSSGPNSGTGGNHPNQMSSFGLGVSQMLRQKRWQREVRSGLFQVGDSIETQDSNLTLGQYQDSMARDEPPRYQSTGGIHDQLPHRREASPLPTSAAQILPVPKIQYPPGPDADLDVGIPAESIDEAVHLIDFAGGDHDEVDLLRISTSSPGGTLASSRSLPSLPHASQTLPMSSASPQRQSVSPTSSSPSTIRSRSGSRHSISAEPQPPTTAEIGVQVGSGGSSDGSGESLDPSASMASTLERPRDSPPPPPPPPPAPLLREEAIKEDSDGSDDDSASSQPLEDLHSSRV